MNIGVLTFEQYEGRKDIGSSRIRGKWLVNHWPEAELFVQGKKYDVVIYQKAYWVEHAKTFDGIKILDVCDPDFLHFGYRTMETLQYVDAVTTSTEALATAFRQFTDKPVLCIPDRIDLELFPHKKVHKGKASSAVWFGYSSNFEMITPALLALNRLDLRLIVVADKPFGAQSQVHVPVDNEKWKDADYQQKILFGDIAINPQKKTGKWQFKSNNKTLMAWALGLPVANDDKDLERFMDEGERIKEANLRGEELKQKWDIRLSVADYQGLINQIKASK